jgi:hypothetical protein
MLLSVEVLNSVFQSRTLSLSRGAALIEVLLSVEVSLSVEDLFSVEGSVGICAKRKDRLGYVPKD